VKTTKRQIIAMGGGSFTRAIWRWSFTFWRRLAGRIRRCVSCRRQVASRLLHGSFTRLAQAPLPADAPEVL
jgi:hypothetical protein